MKISLLTLLMALSTLSAHANLGDTVSQSIARWGEPANDEAVEGTGRVQWKRDDGVLTDVFKNNVCYMFMVICTPPLTGQEVEQFITLPTRRPSPLRFWTAIPLNRNGDVGFTSPDLKYVGGHNRNNTYVWVGSVGRELNRVLGRN
jgi:hypothetical protein